MILKCVVVFMLLCCFGVIFQSYAQGDIENRLAMLAKSVDDLKETAVHELKKHNDDIKKIVTKLLQLTGENERIENCVKADKLLTLSMAEMISYQGSTSGAKGLGYYVELEGIKDGKVKKNIIPILAAINTEQKNPKHSTQLYELLNNVAMSLLENREEIEFENFFKSEWNNDIETTVTTLSNIKSEGLVQLGKQVFLKLLREASNGQKVDKNTCEKICEAIAYYRYDNTDEILLSKLFELWKEVLLKLPVPAAIPFVKRLSSEDHRIIGFEMLLQSSKGDDLLKIVDAMLMVFAKDRKNINKALNLRKHIPYNDESLTEMVKNSSEMFASPKLKAIMIKKYLKSDPSEAKILQLGLDLKKEPKWHLDAAYLKETLEMLPQNILSIVMETDAFCFDIDGRYIYIENFADLRVSEENMTKPGTAGWTLPLQSHYKFTIRNKVNNYAFMFAPKNKTIVKIGPMWPDVGSFTEWELIFSDSYNHVKIGHEGKYIKLNEKNLTLDDSGTIWNFTVC